MLIAADLFSTSRRVMSVVVCFIFVVVFVCVSCFIFHAYFEFTLFIEPLLV